MWKALRIFLRVVAWGTVVVILFFVSSCYLFFDPHLRHNIFGGDYSASAKLGDTGLVATVELVNAVSHLAEFQRYLVVSGNGARASKEIAFDHGGFPRANLYRTADGNYVIAGSLDAWLISTNPVEIKPYMESYLKNRMKGLYGAADLRFIGHGQPPTQAPSPPSNYFEGLVYLGTFDFASERGQPVGSVSRGKFKFVPPNIQGEYIQDPGG
ncbi:protein of unknown function [Hyphomicrobium sp. 1Nfss2.1]|uniref:hypothetical protein n=1 Tax=Hyphomicrobium sp. 1Nfss2.1 TaxID=3413936 RepID=UPI003C7D1187